MSHSDEGVGERSDSLLIGITANRGEQDAMEVLSIKTFAFDELSDTAKATAIEENYEYNTNYDWWDGDYDDFKNVGKCIGIDIDDIYFSGFSSQGDGACFEGRYAYKAGWGKELSGYCGGDSFEEIRAIGKRLQDIQRKSFYAIQASVKQSGHYHHAMCTDIEVTCERSEEYYNPIGGNDIIEELRNFMNWMYSQLNKQYDYLTTDDAIKESFEANDVHFLEDGTKKLYV